MQDEVNQKTVALVVTTSKMTASVLRQVLIKYLQEQQRRMSMKKQNKQYQSKTAYKGRMSVKEFVRTNNGTSVIPIDDGNIRDFDRIAKKHGLKFALEKVDKVTPPKFIVYFRGQDADVLNVAFKEYVAKQQKRKDQPSIRMQLKRAKEILRKLPEKAKTKSKEKAL